MTDRIDAMLAKAGLGRCAVRPVGAGHYNDSYYVDSEKGKFVLRIAPPDSVPKLFYEIDMMKSEVGIHRLVRERTDLPVPQIVHYDFSRDVIDRDYLVMEYLEGGSGFFDESQLGRYVKQLHAVKSDEYGYPERAVPVGKSWPDVFCTYVELILRDCLSCGVIDKNEYDHFMSIYGKYRHVIADVTASLLHLDLWSQNILTQNGRISAILDFDRGLYGDPELEFAVLDTYGYSTPEFFEGYGAPRPCDYKALTRQRLYLVYELIKYAFIRTARGKSMSTGRRHVMQCKRVLQEIE
ncbi:MAG TPA: aminoglycoside phosphotransferase family protein [Sedimentisphaerales bacterium]|nr:aminoglycoside phosphotransferase family protein [Sedimentisphaerales bacterium]